MPVFAVGQPFASGRTTWPEGAHYAFMANEHHLHLFMRSPSDIEIAAVRRGLAEFALVMEQDIILFLYRFDPIPWSDAPYSWHMVPPDQRTIPQDIPNGMGALLTIVLIDATTGIVQALRAIGLGTDFSRALHQSIRDQIVKPFNLERYDGQLNRLYARFPSTDFLLSRAIARYTAGREEPPSNRKLRGKPKK